MFIIIWGSVCLVFILIGISFRNSKKQIQPWANTTIKIKEEYIKQYNKETGNLFIKYAVLLVLAAVPMLFDMRQNSPMAVITILVTVFSSIYLAYGLVRLQNKYK
ncbi:MAG: hypothetical protein E7218_01275 [Anaerofustis stercorihominis]|nr:hypothetical protein [Anaerofustis stercorihominis]